MQKLFDFAIDITFAGGLLVLVALLLVVLVCFVAYVF